MHRSHLLGWLALVVAVFSVQCLELSKDCSKTLTCEGQTPELRSDCRWHYPDGSLWEGGPRRTPEGRWIWPNGKETLTQDLECPLPDAGLGDGGLGGTGGVGNCPEIACDEGLLCEEVSRRCVRCLDDTACTTADDPNRGRLPVCDPRSHNCVVCLRDQDCSSGLRCKVDVSDPSRNQCVECLRQGQCTGNEVCDLGSNECTSTCTGFNQCETPKPICSNLSNGAQTGLCVECTENMHCSGATPQCNTARKECVECVDNTGCSGGQVCNTANRCVECVDDTLCGGDLSNCDLGSNTCVACLNNSQCTSPDNSRCNAVTHECAPCTDDSQCEPGAPVCNSAGRCVACKDNTTCTPEAPLCETSTGTCVACLGNGNCNLDPTQGRCETTTHTCEPCNSPTQCTGKFDVKDLCRTADGECVQCIGNGDCADDAAASRCDQATGLCSRCQVDADCNALLGRRACTGGGSARCVQCVNNTHCASTPATPACKTDTNTCVQCVLDTDCRTAGASRCVNNQCQPCANDGGGSHCGHIVSGATPLTVCDTSGATGVCVQCTGPQRGACGANVCNSTTKVCSPFAVGSAGICQDCVSDAHCPGTDRCVLESFGGVSLGFSCLHLDQDGDCPLTPFADPQPVTTVDGVTATVCLLRETTCAGFNQLGNPCTASADCGEPAIADGICNAMSCTIPCSFPSDCPGNQAGSCQGGFCQ